jgi:hypothetical protein
MNKEKKYTNEKSVESSTPDSSHVSHKTEGSDVFMKVFFIVGLYVSFLFSGIYEEKLYKGNYYNQDDPTLKIKFQHPLLAIFVNSLISCIVSNIILLTM